MLPKCKICVISAMRQSLEIDQDFSSSWARSPGKLLFGIVNIVLLSGILIVGILRNMAQCRDIGSGCGGLCQIVIGVTGIIARMRLKLIIGFGECCRTMEQILNISGCIPTRCIAP